MLAAIFIVAVAAASGDVTAITALPRGTIIQPDMVTGDEDSPVIGKALRRPIYAGKLIRPTDVEAPPLVFRQKSVTIVFLRNGLRLATSGRALESGALGDSVSILLEGRRRPMYGVVIAPGTVEVQS